MLGALATGARASLGNIPLTNHLSCKGTVAAIYGSQRGTFVEAEADLVAAGQWLLRRVELVCTNL